MKFIINKQTKIIFSCNNWCRYTPEDGGGEDGEGGWFECADFRQFSTKDDDSDVTDDDDRYVTEDDDHDVRDDDVTRQLEVLTCSG